MADFGTTTLERDDFRLRRPSRSTYLVGRVIQTYGDPAFGHPALIRGATAAFTKETTHAAHELNGPTYAHAIFKISELIAALSPA